MHTLATVTLADQQQIKIPSDTEDPAAYMQIHVNKAHHLMITGKSPSSTMLLWADKMPLLFRLDTVHSQHAPMFVRLQLQPNATAVY